MSPPTHSTVAVLGDGGLARAVANRLEADGMVVRLSGRSTNSDEPTSVGPNRSVDLVDAADFSAVETFLENVNQDGTLAGVVNCAGSLLLKPAHLTSAEEFSETIRANLTTAFSTVRAAARVLGRQGGSVVLISSAAARLGLPNHEAIAAAKAGICGLVRSAAATYGRRGLRFNAVAPGLMVSPMTERITSNEKALATSSAMHSLGRVGSLEEVASLVSWLLQPDSSWVTGQIWGIDGGLSSTVPR